jgi:hypothetical protein
MIRQLKELINEFKGQECQTRCFTHILNLIAKSIIRQFDVPKDQANKVFDEATTALMDLAGDIDVEEEEMAESGDDGDDDDDEDNENTENWVDERDNMTVEQLAELDESVQPVRLMLVKVRIDSTLFSHNSPRTSQLRKIAFAIKNSSTIILPRWYEVLKELDLNAHMMPRDVSTRWNSTFDMLKFALEYRLAIDTITAERKMKLRDYELGKEEWKVAKELCEVLKVCYEHFHSKELLPFRIDLQGRNTFLLSGALSQTPCNEYRHSYPCHGHH